MSFKLAYRALAQVGAFLIALTIVCGALCLMEVGGVPGMVASGLACWVCLTLVVFIDWRLRVILWHAQRMIEAAVQEAMRREAAFQQVPELMKEEEKQEKEGREP